MDVTFFGRLADYEGRRIALDVPAEGCSLAALRQLISTQYPALGEALAGPGVNAFASSGLVNDEDHLAAAAEIEFWPPVSGG